MSLPFFLPLLFVHILILLLSSFLFPIIKKREREREREGETEKDRESVREAVEEEDVAAPSPLREEEEILSRLRCRWGRIVTRLSSPLSTPVNGTCPVAFFLDSWMNVRKHDSVWMIGLVSENL